MSSIYTRGRLELALAEPVAGPAEGADIGPVADVAPLGPPPLVGMVFVVAWITTGLAAARYHLVVLVRTARRGRRRRSSRRHDARRPERSELVVAHVSPDER